MIRQRRARRIGKASGYRADKELRLDPADDAQAVSRQRLVEQRVGTVRHFEKFVSNSNLAVPDRCFMPCLIGSRRLIHETIHCDTPFTPTTMAFANVVSRGKTVSIRKMAVGVKFR